MLGSVCPISMASGTPANCQPSCKLNNNGVCLLALFMQQHTDLRR